MTFDTQDEQALIALDGLAEEFEAVERELARLSARRVGILNRASEWAKHYADEVIAHSESTGRRIELAHRTMVAELATRVRMSERTLARHVSNAVLLAGMPAVLDQLASGALSDRHAAVIVDEVIEFEAICDSQGEQDRVVEFERAILQVALRTTPAETRRRARSLRERLAPQTIAERHERALEERCVYIEPLPDGMAWLHALLPADVALMSHSALTTRAMAMDDASEAPGALDRSRTLEQRRADLFAEHLMHLPTTAVTHGARRPTTGDRTEPKALPSLRVLVTVPVLTVAGLSEQPGEIDGYGPIPPEMARRMVAHAPSLTRVLTHPITGTVLDVDRTTYKVPKALRTWLTVRDGTCRFPGCSCRAIRCDVDHTKAWAHGGTTADQNLAHLCEKHHRMKHKAGWHVEQLPAAGGVLQWTSPAGKRYTTEPAVEMSVGVTTPAGSERPRPGDSVDT